MIVWKELKACSCLYLGGGYHVATIANDKGYTLEIHLPANSDNRQPRVIGPFENVESAKEFAMRVVVGTVEDLFSSLREENYV